MKKSEKRPAIFIVNEGYHDYSPASEYGDLVFMSSDPAGINLYNTSPMARLFQPYIDSSQPEDYILVTSLTVMVSVACAMFSAKHGRINLLLYKPHDKRYVARTIVMKGEQNNE